MEPENGGHTHTHTQSEYCNARVHARRALIMIIHTYLLINNALTTPTMPCYAVHVIFYQAIAIILYYLQILYIHGTSILTLNLSYFTINKHNLQH